MRRVYLEEANPLLLNFLILTGKLYTYLADLDKQARERYQRIVRQMVENEGITEELKLRSVSMGMGQSHEQHRKLRRGNHQGG